MVRVREGVTNKVRIIPPSTPPFEIQPGPTGGACPHYGRIQAGSLVLRIVLENQPLPPSWSRVEAESESSRVAYLEPSTTAAGPGRTPRTEYRLSDWVPPPSTGAGAGTGTGRPAEGLGPGSDSDADTDPGVATEAGAPAPGVEALIPRSGARGTDADRPLDRGRESRRPDRNLDDEDEDEDEDMDMLAGGDDDAGLVAGMAESGSLAAALGVPPPGNTTDDLTVHGAMLITETLTPPPIAQVDQVVASGTTARASSSPSPSASQGPGSASVDTSGVGSSLFARADSAVLRAIDGMPTQSSAASPGAGSTQSPRLPRRLQTDGRAVAAPAVGSASPGSDAS